MKGDFYEKVHKKLKKLEYQLQIKTKKGKKKKKNRRLGVRLGVRHVWAWMWKGVGGWGEHGCVVGKEGNVGILDFFMLILILLDAIGFELNLNAFMGIRLNMSPMRH